jgi:excisionase family DNA binding protein
MINLLTVRQVASILGISTKRIYALIREGRLQVVKLGPRQTRILKDSLETFIQTASNNSTHPDDGD